MPTAKKKEPAKEVVVTESDSDEKEESEEEEESESEEEEEESESEEEEEESESPPVWALTESEWNWMKQQVSAANKKKGAPPSKPKKEAPQSDGAVVVHAEATTDQKHPMTRREKRHGKKRARSGQA